MVVMFKQKTKITKGATKANSVRTTLPAPIAQMMEIGVGDFIEWTVESNNDKIILTVTKVE